MAETGTDTFSAFSAYGQGDRLQRSWTSSLLASSTIYVVVGLLIAALSATKTIVERKKPVDVKFVEKVVKEPPPPEPKIEPVPPPPVAAPAPVVRPDMKVRKLDKPPPPPKPLAAPKEMPTNVPKEADASQDKGIAVYGDAGKGDPAGLEGGMAGAVASAVALPEDADPPVPSEANDKPAYPQVARTEGREGMVILKVYILASGQVAKVELMRGDEPFASAAMAAVKQWKYTPAMYKGHAISVYRIIQIPFRLTA